MKCSALYHVFPATFHVISRKVDYLWDSVSGYKNPFCKLFRIHKYIRTIEHHKVGQEAYPKFSESVQSVL